MNLGILVQMYEAGALKVTECGDQMVEIGGTRLNLEQCGVIAKNLGWLSYEMSPELIIDKTNKFIRGIKGYITNEFILKSTEVEFQNWRKSNTMSYYDRIRMVIGNRLELVILYNMGGKGAKYEVYDGRVSLQPPIAKLSTLKQLGTFINNLV